MLPIPDHSSIIARTNRMHRLVKTVRSLPRQLALAATMLFAVGTACAAPASSSAQPAEHDQLAQIMAHHVLRVAVPKDFPPFGYMKGAAPVGYDISVARMLGIELGLPVELVPVASADRIPLLQSGKVDLVIASLGKTLEREGLIDFSIAYAPLYLGVFGRSGSAADVSGRRVAVLRGSLEDTELRKVAPHATPVELDSTKEIIQAYVDKKIDYIAVGSPVIETIDDLPTRDQTKLLITLKDSPCYIGIRKGEQRLLERVNKTLLDTSRSGVMTLNALTWFKATLPKDFFKR